MGKKKKEEQVCINIDVDNMSIDEFTDAFFAVLAGWHQNQTEEKQDNIAFFAVVGNMEDGFNRSIHTKNERALYLALVQEFHANPEFKKLCIDAINFVDKYEIEDLIKTDLPDSKFLS